MADLAAARTLGQAAEEARAETARRFDELSRKHDALQTARNGAVEAAAAAQADAANLRQRMEELGHAIEVLTQDRDRARNELVEAAARQQTDEAAARQFENIGHKILKETLEEARREVGELAERFKKSSGEELEKHAETVARTLEPLKVKLAAYDEAVESLKKNTNEAYGGLREQLAELQKTERTLHDQARALTTALSASPKVKGTYGEILLKQLVEFVGMQEHCHFETQAARDTEEGRKIPDMVVALPGGQKVLVDSKAVMDACIEAYRSQDDAERGVLLKRHCDNVKSRVVDLSAKNYFVDHADAVEAVVLFLPAENLYAAAVENDPELTEFALRRNIIICGPNTLIMLLKVATQIWRRAAIEEEAQQIVRAGNDVYRYACDFVAKFAKLGVKIRQLETDYNDAAGTLDSRLIPAGRGMGRFAAVTSNRRIEDVALLRDDLREYRSPEAKKQLALDAHKQLLASTNAESAPHGSGAEDLVFSTGDESDGTDPPARTL
jgi:DNA recombination protein RmuC